MASHSVVDLGTPENGRTRLWATIAGYPAWLVVADIYLAESGASLGELRIAPRQDTRVRVLGDRVMETDRPPAGKHWSENAADVPAGGIPARLIRAINAGELLDLARTEAAMRGPTMASRAERFAHNPTLATYLDAIASADAQLAKPGRRPGKRGNGREHYLLWAKRYADAVEAGVRNPMVYLAAEHGKTRRYVTDTVTDARRRYKFLTSAGQGRAGGQLTQKAFDELARNASKIGENNGG